MPDLPCVITNGGPLIALSRALVDAWHGALPSPEAPTPPGWEYGDGRVVCDYDRACEPPVDSVVVADSTSTWMVDVGGGRALVLDEECCTAALRWDDGLVIVRDVGAASEQDTLELIAEVPEGGWVTTPFEVDLSSGAVFLFDAAYSGRERDSADGGVLEAELVPGVYRIFVAFPRAGNGGRTTLVRLSGPAQASPRGSAGVSVR